MPEGNLRICGSGSTVWQGKHTWVACRLSVYRGLTRISADQPVAEPSVVPPSLLQIANAERLVTAFSAAACRLFPSNHHRIFAGSAGLPGRNLPRDETISIAQNCFCFDDNLFAFRGGQKFVVRRPSFAISIAGKLWRFSPLP